jgi:nitrate reductase gamma subunit
MHINIMLSFLTELRSWNSITFLCIHTTARMHIMVGGSLIQCLPLTIRRIVHIFSTELDWFARIIENHTKL